MNHESSIVLEPMEEEEEEETEGSLFSIDIMKEEESQACYNSLF